MDVANQSDGLCGIDELNLYFRSLHKLQCYAFRLVIGHHEGLWTGLMFCVDGCDGLCRHRAAGTSAGHAAHCCAVCSGTRGTVLVQLTQGQREMALLGI
jgi:hypothetical protein